LLSALPARNTVALVCPKCRGPLTEVVDAFRCDPCGTDYPLHAGIPDFRLFPDPYLNWEEDRNRTNFVLQALPRLSLPDLLQHYWGVSDVTPEALRGNFIRSVLLGERKAERIVRLLGETETVKGARWGRALEVGSGTGNFLAVAARTCDRVVGVDIAMRWLHVSRRRFLDKKVETPTLVCGCAEHLPFPDKYFELVVCNATLEFARDQDRLFAECARVLKDDGIVYISTVNRFSLTQDPYVYLWGVGLLPRALQAPYVRWRRDASYENIRLLSLRELKRMAARYFARRDVALPDIDDISLGQFPWMKRLQVRIYRALKQVPLLKHVLLWVTPQWDVTLRAPRRRQ
jgi:ubiquinone/menaquinone biosynthesis C-methylase UbiE/uncharacterized protein YbaR (Trm112 family)